MTRTTGAVLLICLAIAFPAAAQDLDRIQTFRRQYDDAMANFQRAAQASDDTAAAQRAAEGRQAMRALTDDQLAKLFSKTRVPDFSVVAMATQYLASKGEANKKAAAATLVPIPTSPGLPGPDPVLSNCNSVDTSAATRYTQLIAKEVANSILAAAAWACNEDILGENGS